MKPEASFVFPTLFGFAVALSGCGPENKFQPPPPPAVDVQKPTIKDTTIYLEFPGRTQAFKRVEIRARVQGFLKSREFSPGQFVREDQLLFKIEPEQFQAAVAAAEGNLDKAVADFGIAETHAKRRREAFEKNQAVSEIDALAAEAETKSAEAAIAIADAALSDAKRDLSYTEIVSPVAGRVSRDLVDQGNLVGASEPTLLTTVIRDDPVYFNFEVNERVILPYLRNRPSEDRPEISDNKVRDASAKPPPGETEVARAALRLMLSDGTAYPDPGEFDFIDNAVDPESGTVKVRAVFKNNEGDLADGLFARIGIPQTVEQAVLVPRATVQRDPGGNFILLVGEGNKVERRVVIPSAFTAGENRIIEPFDEEKNTGLKMDDRIIISNLQRARPGIEVNPKEAADSPAGAGDPPKEPEPEPAPGSAEEN